MNPNTMLSAEWVDNAVVEKYFFIMQIANAGAPGKFCDPPGT